MSNKDYKKLVMVTENNNNKFYEMIWDGGANFTVNYGRVEATSQTETYPYSRWKSKYNEKIRKGYEDVTGTVAVQVQSVLGKVDRIDSGDKKVDEFLNLMFSYRDKLVSTTYSVKSESVTQFQVTGAQVFIDNLVKLGEDADDASVNSLLIKLYTIIPRKMRNVKDFLLPNINFAKTLQQEQDNLDAMKSQVGIMVTPTKGKKNTGFLSNYGLTMSTVTKHPEIDYLLKQSFSGRVEAVFAATKDSEDKDFKDWLKTRTNKSSKVLIHGTRCSSVVPILETSLKIRPAGSFQFSGKAYGEGNYFSEVMSKSLNYVGYDKDKILLVYEVHTGNPFVYEGWFRGNSFSLNFTELQKRGFDSTYVKAGNGLLNSEIIAYSEKQNRLKYIIWLKN